MESVKVIMETHKGDPIPEWLLYLDPTNKNAVRGKATFGCEGIIIEYNDVFWIIPKDLVVDSYIRIDNAEHNNIGANTKTIIIPLTFMTLTSEGTS